MGNDLTIDETGASTTESAAAAEELAVLEQSVLTAILEAVVRKEAMKSAQRINE